MTQNCRYDAYRSAGYSAKMSRNLCSLDSIAIANLNYLIAQTEAKIVVSSTWRGDDPFLQEVFAVVGIPAYIGITPYTETRHRGLEINYWLDKHPEVENYVILDDDNDMLEEQLEYFVQTGWAEGLNEECADKAVEILNKEVC